MAKIPQNFMGLPGKFADSLDYNDLPKGGRRILRLLKRPGNCTAIWARKARFSRPGLETGLRQKPVMKPYPGDR